MELTIYRCGHRIKLDSEDFDLRCSPRSGKPRVFTVSSDGYVRFNRCHKYGKNSPLHRCIVERMIGRPLLKTEHIDHINCDRLDNRRCNLRVVTQRQNNQNLKMHREGKLVGANFCTRSRRWRARIKINNKNISIGSYSTELEAHNAYIEFLKKEGFDEPVRL